jgi:hypothetical protein
VIVRESVMMPDVASGSLLHPIRLPQACNCLSIVTGARYLAGGLSDFDAFRYYGGT